MTDICALLSIKMTGRGDVTESHSHTGNKPNTSYANSTGGRSSSSVLYQSLLARAASNLLLR